MNLYFIPLDEGGLEHYLGDYVIIMSENKESAKEKFVDYYKKKIGNKKFPHYNKENFECQLNFALENFEKWEIIEDGIWDSYFGE